MRTALSYGSRRDEKLQCPLSYGLGSRVSVSPSARGLAGPGWTAACRSGSCSRLRARRAPGARPPPCTDGPSPRSSSTSMTMRNDATWTCSPAHCEPVACAHVHCSRLRLRSCSRLAGRRHNLPGGARHRLDRLVSVHRVHAKRLVCADLRRDSLGDGLCKRPDDLTGGATMQCAPAQAGHTHAVSGRWHSLCARVGMAMYREDSSRQCALCVRAMRRS